MNIDFHYVVTYAVSRLAGLSVHQAQVVAHAAQYVDDATTSGMLHFSGGQAFDRIASSHEMWDIKNNSVNDVDRVVWALYHFIPAGEGATFEQQLVCRPDTAAARLMVRHMLQDTRSSQALHRLGITLHAYVDTWAHQGFSGICSEVNTVTDLRCSRVMPNTLGAAIQSSWSKVRDDVVATALNSFSKLGHGSAMHYPDMPWAHWSYRDSEGRLIVRDNLTDFMDAANMMGKVVQAYCAGSVKFDEQPGLTAEAKVALKKLLGTNLSGNEFSRANRLMAAIAEGEIPGLKESVPVYIAKGIGSWKEKATGLTSVDDGDTAPAWGATFETSDYRKFHDALKDHRYTVTNFVMPEIGLRVA